jgi:hypothetical protein
MIRRGKNFSGPRAQSRALAVRNAKIIREYSRKTNPLTQEELAEKYGLTQGTVSLIVRNRNATKVAA